MRQVSAIEFRVPRELPHASAPAPSLDPGAKLTHDPAVPLLPFTPFQQFSRHWEQFCPQNAAQVLLLEGTPDPDIVESAWQSTLRDMGLGRIHVDEDEGGYSHEIWSGDPPAPLVSHHAGELELMPYLQAELNRPFLAAPVMPYRPFAMQTQTGCYLGVIYQQWIADSVSIRLLMREWFLRVHQPNKARRKLIDLPRIRIARGPDLGYHPRNLLRAARYCFRWFKQARTLRRFPSTDAPSRIILRELTLAAAELDDLLMVTRAEGCTVNDLLIAILAATLESEFATTPDQPMALAIATSIDLRPYMPGDLSETFGSLLAYAPVVCNLPCPNRLNLAQEISRQTHRLKDPERIAHFLALPRIATWIAERREGKQRLDFYRRNAAIAASIANVNLNKSWAAIYHPAPIKSYIRLASPNPAMPLVLSTSTLGDALNVVVAADESAISEAQTERIAGAFAANVHALIQSRPGR